jgi:DNA-directed RNA polymerase specialized sigma24 family protein
MEYATITPEELVLICFQTRDELAWAEFVRRFHPLIARVVLRVARHWGQNSHQAIDDLVQEVYLKLCADDLNLLRNFKSSHEGAIYGYLKVFTANLAQDHFKASHAKKRGGTAQTGSLDACAVEERGTLKEPEVAAFERKILLGQVAACLAAVASGSNAKRDCRMFWLYYRVGLSASAIAALPTIGLSTKGVESTLLRLTRQVRDRLTASKPKNSSPGRINEGVQSAESFYKGEC